MISSLICRPDGKERSVCTSGDSPLQAVVAGESLFFPIRFSLLLEK